MGIEGKFYGYAEGRLDDKNRIFLPEKFRRAFPQDEKVWVCLTVPPIEEEACVRLYSPQAWTRVHFGLKAWAKGTADPEAFLERVDRRTESVDLDSQGRFLIPQHLADLAMLSKREPVHMVGRGEYVAIWAEEAWKRRSSKVGDLTGDPAKQVKEILGGYSPDA